MDLSVIIVSWNVKEKLKNNLKALLASQGDFKFEVFVVDNNSQDGTVSMLKTEFPGIKLIINNDNLGFAKANNQAIKESKGDFILLLNPDMLVKENTLINILTWMNDKKEASVASCKLIDEKNNLIKHVRRFPCFLDQLAIVLKLPHLFPKILNKYLFIDFNYNKAQKVDSVRGSFFMIKRETIEKIGLLDESFFIWFEEVDYCKRIKAANLETWYMPDAICIDYIGQSFGQVKRKTTQNYFKNSMLIYFKKWHPSYQVLILSLAWFVSDALIFIADIFKIKTKNRT